MYKSTHYVSKKPDIHGIVHYTDEENQTWHDLYTRQIEIIQHRACDKFIDGLALLNLSSQHIPQLPDVNRALNKATGWSVAPVAALIGFDEFFNLLANRKFPAATFIRTREDFDYIQEPDIFHELFGHCPLLTDPIYADFMQKYGVLGVNATHKDRLMLARLYWFTVEFGLINTKQGLRIYGGGVLSSKNETIYALENNMPERNSFNVLNMLRTPYRIDIMQPVYFVINEYAELYDLVNTDLMSLIQEARALGEFAPRFTHDNEGGKHPC